MVKIHQRAKFQAISSMRSLGNTRKPQILPVSLSPKSAKIRTRQIWGIWKLRPAYSPETPNLGQKRWCFVPCDLEIWWMTLENNRASLCSVSYPMVNSNWSYSPEMPNLVQIRRFLEPCDLEIWRRPSKTIGHLFYATSSFVQHFIAIGEFKLELQSGNAQFGSNSTIFRAMWPWNLTYDLEKQ